VAVVAGSVLHGRIRPSDSQTESAYDASLGEPGSLVGMMYWLCQERIGTLVFSGSGLQLSVTFLGRALDGPGLPVLDEYEEGESNMSDTDTDSRTGTSCVTAGIYRSDCADQERVTMAVGDTFPKCPSCRKAVAWRMAAAT